MIIGILQPKMPGLYKHMDSVVCRHDKIREKDNASFLGMTRTRSFDYFSEYCRPRYIFNTLSSTKFIIGTSAFSLSSAEIFSCVGIISETVSRVAASFFK